MEKIDATYLSSYKYEIKKWGTIKNGFTHFANGDVAFAKITPCFQNRKSMILSDLPNGIGAGTTELKVLRVYGETISKEYLLFFLESPYFVEEASFKGTANQQRIVSGYLESKLFPLPPLAEQQRIVAKLEEVMPVVDRYDKAQVELDKLNDNINDLLKKSILQEAIQGRLVQQSPGDEPVEELLNSIRKEKQDLVKQGKLKPKDITDSTIFRGDDNRYYEKVGKETVDITDSRPFEIPESWRWVRLKEVCSYIHRGKTPSYGTTHELPIIAQKCNQWDKIYTDRCLFAESNSINRYTEEHYLQMGDTIINSTGGGTVGRTGYVEEYVFNKHRKFVVDSHVTIVRGSVLICKKYMYFYLISPYIQTGLEDRCSGSTNQIELGTDTIREYLLPLPSVEEQRRIVAKIDELFANIYGR